MKNLQKGQTLIEALVALAIIMILLTSITSILSSSLYNSQFIKEQNRANKYSQEGMEVIRAYQVSNISGFKDLPDGDHCIDNLGVIVSSGSCMTAPNVGGNMFRIINTVKNPSCSSPPAPGECLTEVKVTTSWNSSKCNGTGYCHSAEIITSLPYSNGVTP